MNDEKTNFERHEDNLEFETKKPSALAEARAVPGLNVEAVQPVITHPENIGAPLPAAGEGLHGEPASTPIPQAPPRQPSKESKLVTSYETARDRDIQAQGRGEISDIYDLSKLYDAKREG